MSVRYISAEEAAKKWNIALERVIKGCETGQIKGAAVFEGNWIIPEDLEKPKLRFKREKKNSEPVSDKQRYKDTIYRLTMQGFPDFDIKEYTFGKTTFLVSCCYDSNSKDTVETAMFRHILSEIEKEDGYKRTMSAAEKDKLFTELRKKAAEKMQSSQALRKYYYDKFMEIGYSDEEMKILMEKIDSHIENRNKNFNVK